MTRDLSELNQRLLALARQYAQVAQEVLGDNLTSVVLYGSVARGEAELHSDIDLLIVCRELPRGLFRRQEVLQPVRDRLYPALEALWQQGCYSDFSELLKTEAEAQHTIPPYLDMTEDALLLYDRDGFFAGILQRLRARLAELGAQRKRLGKIRYWDLKPDFQPGEVIEL
ncbi:MAG: nucleotidyltransferase domain-containing protein [Armatimonadota bacterium]|nr:nucleotidyltransferase domain-containing protein [Armatimonadota bacterium]